MGLTLGQRRIDQGAGGGKARQLGRIVEGARGVGLAQLA
jgi:hypothetical protein